MQRSCTALSLKHILQTRRRETLDTLLIEDILGWPLGYHSIAWGNPRPSRISTNFMLISIYIYMYIFIYSCRVVRQSGKPSNRWAIDSGSISNIFANILAKDFSRLSKLSVHHHKQSKIIYFNLLLILICFILLQFQNWYLLDQSRYFTNNP